MEPSVKLSAWHGRLHLELREHGAASHGAGLEALVEPSPASSEGE